MHRKGKSEIRNFFKNPTNCVVDEFFKCDIRVHLKEWQPWHIKRERLKKETTKKKDCFLLKPRASSSSKMKIFYIFILFLTVTLLYIGCFFVAAMEKHFLEQSKKKKKKLHTFSKTHTPKKKVVIRHKLW